jgi:PHD/YefM family antitoxin component YafN of YafNO toxin-antitoxin module
MMTALAALQSVQYITAKGRRFAVVEVDDWEAMIEWLEDQEDLRLVRQAYAELKAAGGNRKRAGWLKWDEVKEEIT